MCAGQRQPASGLCGHPEGGSSAPETHSSPGTPRWDSGYGDAVKWPWIEKTIPVHPANGYKMTEIYKYLYAAIREGVPFPVKPEEAFAVIKTTAEIKKQNPQFRIQEDLFEE